MSNGKQLTLAWIMYAQDNNEQVTDARSWLPDDGGWFPSTDSTNINILKGGVLNSLLGRQLWGVQVSCSAKTNKPTR
jgi:hypothetical protein